MSTSPQRITSPSPSRWRPCTRLPLTNVPLRESPPSTTVHASPTRSDGVHARHLGVPTEPDAPIDLAPDHDPLAVQGHDLLAASVASQHDEGNLGPLGLQPALQFRDGRQGKDRRSHNRILVDAIPGDGCAEGRRPQREHVSGRVHQTDGFDWGDAAIGAVGALVIMLAVAAARAQLAPAAIVASRAARARARSPSTGVSPPAGKAPP